MNQQRDLEGISALVTGASSGIGRAAAEELGRHGAEVNNAGFSWFGPTGDLDVATFDRLFAANVRAPYFLVAAPERIEALGAMTLLSRAAQPSEIAEILAFLASPKASYVTGAVIAADGGRTAI